MFLSNSSRSSLVLVGGGADCSYSCERARKELGYAPGWDLETGMKKLATELEVEA